MIVISKVIEQNVLQKLFITTVYLRFIMKIYLTQESFDSLTKLIIKKLRRHFLDFKQSLYTNTQT